MDDLRIGGLHDQYRPRLDDALAFVRPQVARHLRPAPQILYRIHYLRLLGKKCVAQRLQPLQVLVHAREHMREGQQGFHAGIPVLIHRRPYRIFPAQVRMTS